MGKEQYLSLHTRKCSYTFMQIEMKTVYINYKMKGIK